MHIDLRRLFSRDGPLAALDPAFEERPQQVDMAVAVFEALSAGRGLAVEAGTGVGKSLAYLLPGALWAVAQRRRLAVSTHTRTLQEQLMGRELPLAAAALAAEGVAVRFAMLMGSDNYLCVRRLERHRRRPRRGDEGDAAALERIAAWAADAPTGQRQALPELVPEAVWSRVCRDPDLCLGTSCARREDCLYRRDWLRAEQSDILVVNHALLLSSPRLPAYGGLIVDEAHSLEEAAVSHYGIGVTDGRFAWVLSEIAPARGGHGLLRRLRGLGAAERRAVSTLVAECREGADLFFAALAEGHGLPWRPGMPRREPRPGDTQSKRLRPGGEFKGWEPLRRLEAALADLAPSCADAEEEADLRASAVRLARLRHDLSAFLDARDPSVAHWIEAGGGRIALQAWPLDVAGLLEKGLLSKEIPVVMTSATLSAGRGLGEFKARVGFPGASELVLDSPFDYGSQAGLLLVPGLPDPKDEAGYDEAVAGACLEIAGVVRGGLLLLFSSWRMLRRVATALRAALPHRPVWTQGEFGNEALIERFAETRNAVLLGVDTFWQGIDVHNGALSCVVMAKLPFPNFATPLEEARREWLESLGKSHFEDYSVPKAVVKFRQGFGRLIRSFDDRGAVVVLDSRLLRRRYGASFLEALPPCRRLESVAELGSFLESVRRD